MKLTDEEFTEQVSNLVGDIALSVARLLQSSNPFLFGDGPRELTVQKSIKQEWITLTQRTIKLIND